jgi:RNA 2',3'-cyclic 3'-phosphodiesterase
VVVAVPGVRDNTCVRLFAALVPPPAAIQELATAVRPLHSLPEASALRWTSLPTWHLTLAFLGQVEDAALPGLEAGFASAAAGRTVFELRLGGGGRFGDRALWAGVHGDTAALGRLADEAADVARSVGVDVDDHPFQGHLTLARSGIPRTAGRNPVHRAARGAGRPAGPDLRPLAAALADFRGEPWEASTLLLMRSHLGTGPARYETLGAWPLTRA